MAKKRTDLKITYGVSDFRRIRNEGLYYVDKTHYLAQMEARDSFGVPNACVERQMCEIVGGMRM